MDFSVSVTKKNDLNKKKKKKNISFTKLYNLFQSIGTRFFQLSKHIKVTVIQMSRLQKLCKHKNRMAGLQFETELWHKYYISGQKKVYRNDSVWHLAV